MSGIEPLKLTGDPSGLVNAFKDGRRAAERDGAVIERAAEGIARELIGLSRDAPSVSKGFNLLGQALETSGAGLNTERIALEAVNESLLGVRDGLELTSEVLIRGETAGNAYFDMLEHGIDVNSKLAKKVLNTARGIDDLVDEQRAATSVGRDYRKSLEDQTKALKVQAKFLDAGEAELEARIRLMKAGNQVEEAYAKEVLDTARALDKQRKETEEATAAARRHKTVIESLGGLSRIVQGVFAIAAVEASRRAVIAVAEAYADFSDEIQGLSAITGQTGGNLDFLTEEAIAMGREFGRAGKEVAEAFTLTASARPQLLENKEALAATTREVIVLAKAAKIDLATSADALGGSLNQFTNANLTAREAINVLAAGSKLGSSVVADSTQALRNFGGIADTLGVSFESANAAIQVLAKGNVKGVLAGTQLKIILQKLETQVDDGLRPSIVGLSGAFEELNRRELTSIQLKELFGEEATNAANTLSRNVVAFKELEAGLKDTDIAYEQAGIRQNSLRGDMDKLGASVDILKVRLGQASEGSLRDFTQGLTEATDKFSDFIRALTLQKEIDKLEETLGEGFFEGFLAGSNEAEASAVSLVTKLKELFRNGIGTGGDLSNDPGFKALAEAGTDLAIETFAAQVEEYERIKKQLQDFYIDNNAAIEEELGKKFPRAVIQAGERMETAFGQYLEKTKASLSKVDRENQGYAESQQFFLDTYKKFQEEIASGIRGPLNFAGLVPPGLLAALGEAGDKTDAYGQSVSRLLIETKKQTDVFRTEAKFLGESNDERKRRVELAKAGIKVTDAGYEAALAALRLRDEEEAAILRVDEARAKEEQGKQSLENRTESLLASLRKEIELTKGKIASEDSVSKAVEARLLVEKDLAEANPEKLKAIEEEIEKLEELKRQLKEIEKFRKLKKTPGSTRFASVFGSIDEIQAVNRAYGELEEELTGTGNAFGYLTREMIIKQAAAEKDINLTDAQIEKYKELLKAASAKELAGQFQEGFVDSLVDGFQNGFTDIAENWQDLLTDMLGEWQKSNITSLLNGEEATGLGDAVGLGGTQVGELLNKPVVSGGISGYLAGQAAADRLGYGTQDAQIQGTLGGLVAGASTGNPYAALAGAVLGAFSSGVFSGSDWEGVGTQIAVRIQDGAISNYRESLVSQRSDAFFGGTDTQVVQVDFVDTELQSDLSNRINDAISLARDEATELGFETADAIRDAFFGSIDLDFTGLEGPEIERAINDAISRQQNSLIAQILPQIGAFVNQDLGEDFGTTFERLAAASRAVNDQFTGMGLVVEDFINQAVLDQTEARLQAYQDLLIENVIAGNLELSSVIPQNVLDELDVQAINDAIAAGTAEAIDFVNISGDLFALAITDFKDRMAAAAGGAEGLRDIFERYTRTFEDSQEFLDRELLRQIDNAEQYSQDLLVAIGSSRETYVADLEAALSSGELTPEEITAFFAAGAGLADLMALERDLAEIRGQAIQIGSLTVDQLEVVNGQTEVLNQNMAALGLSVEFFGQDLLNLESVFGTLGEFQGAVSGFVNSFSSPEQLAGIARQNGERVLSDFGIGLSSGSENIRESIRQIMVEALEAGNFEDAERIYRELGPAATLYLDALREEERIRTELVDATLAFNQQMNTLHPGITLSVDAMQSLQDVLGGVDEAASALDSFYDLIDGTSLDTFDPSSFLSTFGLDVARLAAEGQDYLAQIASDAFAAEDWERFRIIMNQLVPIAQDYIDTLDSERDSREELTRDVEEANAALNVFGSSIVLSVEQFNALAESVGGSEALSQGLDYVFDNFLTSADQTQIQWQLATQEIENAGYNVQEFIDIGHGGFAEMVRLAAETGNGPLLDLLLEIAPAVSQILGPIDGLDNATDSAAASLANLESALGRVANTAQNSIRSILSNGISGQGPTASLTSRISSLTGQVNDVSISAERRLNSINELIPLIETQYVNTRDQIIAGQEAIQASLQATAQLEADRARQQYDAAVAQYEIERAHYDDLIRLAQSLRDYVQDISTGELSGLSLDARLALVQQQFNAEVRGTLAGTDDGGDLQSLAQQLLQIGQERFASSPAFQEIREQTLAQIQEVLGFVDSQKEPDEPIEPTIREISVSAASTAVHTASMPLISAAQQEAVNQIEALRRQAEELAEEERQRQEAIATQERLDREQELANGQTQAENSESIKVAVETQTATMDSILALHANGNDQLDILNTQLFKLRINLEARNNPTTDPLVAALANQTSSIVGAVKANTAAVNYWGSTMVDAIGNVAAPSPEGQPLVIPLGAITPGVS